MKKLGIKAEYIDSMGDDLSVVNAARVSFDKTSAWEFGLSEAGLFGRYLSKKDVNLIKYLAKHNHWTPFAHTSITLRMSAPVPIRTQCFKHKAGFIENEESRRYIDSVPEIFIPEFRMAAENVKQGSGGLHPDNEYWGHRYEQSVSSDVKTYLEMIAANVAPEQARFILPQGAIVNWIWTGNLVSFARFYNQRTDSHSQQETQDLASQAGGIISKLYPVSWAALTGDE